MNIKRIFNKIFRKAKEFVFKFYSDNKARIFESAKDLARQAIGTVRSYDLSVPEQRAEATQIVLNVSAATGLMWFAELAEKSIDEARDALFNGTDKALKKWLHIALLARPLIQQYGISLVPPQYKFISFVIEWVLNEIEEETAQA